MTDDNGEGYLMPKNANVLYDNNSQKIEIRNGIKISDFLGEISSKQPNLLVVFIDACFSGSDKGDASINQGIAKAGVRRTTKQTQLPDNLIYFSATTDASPAYPYVEQKHGLFTYA